MLSAQPPADVTRLLDAVASGDAQAAGRLLPLVYDELRRLAVQKLARERPGHSLQATALVHEAYLRLIGTDPEQPWDGRGHFFAAAAEAMRRILVENARRKRAIKHGGDRAQQDLNDELIAAPEPREDLLALDEALDKLAETNRQAADLVQLRYFAGLTLPEAAEALGMAPRTAGRLWAYARAWLRRVELPKWQSRRQLRQLRQHFLHHPLWRTVAVLRGRILDKISPCQLLGLIRR